MTITEHYYLRLKIFLDYIHRIYSGEEFNFGVFYTEEFKSFIKKCQTFFEEAGESIPELQSECNCYANNLNELLFELHPDAILEIINKCTIYFNLLESKIISLNKNNYNYLSSRINDLISDSERLFKNAQKLFSENEKTINLIKSVNTMLREQTNNQDISAIPTLSAVDYLITATTAFLCHCFLTIDNVNNIPRFLQCVTRTLNNGIIFKGVLPNDIYLCLKQLPQNTYQGLILYLTEDGIIDHHTYYDLTRALNDDDEDVFVSVILNSNGLSWLDKYYYLISLNAFLFNLLTEQYFEPSKFFSTIADFLSQENGDIKSTNVLSVFNEIMQIDGLIPNHYKVLSDEIFFNDEIKTLYSQEINKNRIANTSIQQDSITSIESKKYVLNVIDNNDGINCVDQAKENLDEFIMYLAWRNYISEDEIKSFKYIVFGGQMPSIFNKEMIFKSEEEGSKPLLANILWLLRKDSPKQSITIFGQNVTLSNCSIGTKSMSQRVFVDLCLFFPFLKIKLKFKKNKNVEEVKNKLSTCVIELLHDNGGEPYSLRDIQNLQESKGEYWIVK